MADEGADKVARFLLRIAAKGRDFPGLRMVVADVNGSPASWAGRRRPYMALSPVVGDDGIEQVLVVVNPAKLAGLGQPPGGP